MGFKKELETEIGHNLICDLTGLNDDKFKKKQNRVIMLKMKNRESQEGLELESKILDEMRVKLNGRRFSDMIIYRFLGKGCFGLTYLCKVKETKSTDIFVMKICKPKVCHSNPDMMDLVFQRDGLILPFHPNVVSILSICPTEKNDEILPKSLPDYNGHYQKPYKSGMVLMNYFESNLEEFVIQKLERKEKLSIFEVCRIVLDILRGIVFLHKNKVVHRDLHLGNIFIDDVHDRICIGDFGCALDLSGPFNDDEEVINFKVRYNSPILLHPEYSDYLVKGGVSNFLPPEILDFEDHTQYLDYSKCDVFSVGVIFHVLISLFCCEEEEGESIIEEEEEEGEEGDGKNDENFDKLLEDNFPWNSEERFNYNELSIDGDNSEINDLIKKLIKDMLQDFEKRKACEEALKEIERITMKLEEG